jgi:hypothetical protein
MNAILPDIAISPLVHYTSQEMAEVYAHSKDIPQIERKHPSATGGQTGWRYPG